MHINHLQYRPCNCMLISQLISKHAGFQETHKLKTIEKTFNSNNPHNYSPMDSGDPSLQCKFYTLSNDETQVFSILHISCKHVGILIQYDRFVWLKGHHHKLLKFSLSPTTFQFLLSSQILSSQVTPYNFSNQSFLYLPKCFNTTPNQNSYG